MKICPRCSELFTDDARFCPHDGTELDKSRDRFLGRKIAARYHLIKKLGSGGMSVVYLARHEVINRLSAIKILRPELAQIKEHHDRFIREARAVNRINHPNIVEITDVGESDGITYLVMEYIEGRSLLDAIQSGRMPWPRAVKLGMQIASALARTHQAGIIHRDLKPENILLLPVAGDPPDEMVKILDFGIAKVSGEPTLTMNQQLFGTPGYIAPEYVGGLPIDGRADLYSLAVVLYELVTGVLPFDARGQSELLLKPLTHAPVPPGQRVDGLPPDLESLLLRGLARDPNERPHDAFAFHDALADILRRYGAGSVAPPGAGRAKSDAPQAARHEPLETIVDRISVPPLARESSRDTTNLGRLATREMASRWHAALADLEALIAKARRLGGEHALAANRAGDMAIVAGEMIPRLERASARVAELQARVDRLEAKGREFRANLGHAVDVLVHDRSREQAHIAQLRARRQAVERAMTMGIASSPSPLNVTVPLAPPISSPGLDPRVWEIEALTHEEKRADGVVADLSFQIETLQRQLDQKNEELERELLGASGTLEGSLGALRHLTSELVRTIDDGVDMLQ